MRKALLTLVILFAIFNFQIGLVNARISDPSLSTLVKNSELIVLCRTEYNFYSIANSIIGIIVILVIIRNIYQMRFSNFIYNSMMIVVSVSLYFTFQLGIESYQRKFAEKYHNKTNVVIYKIIKGNCANKIIPVAYGADSPCDATNLSPWKTYVLFLNKINSKYTLSWHDWSQWTVNWDKVQTIRRKWRDLPEIPLDKFITAINSDDPSHLIQINESQYPVNFIKPGNTQTRELTGEVN